MSRRSSRPQLGQTGKFTVFMSFATGDSASVSRQMARRTTGTDSDDETATCWTGLRRWLCSQFGWSPKSTRVGDAMRTLSQKGCVQRELLNQRLLRIKQEEQKRMQELTAEIDLEFQLAQCNSYLEKQRLTFQRDELVKLEDEKARCAEDANRTEIQQLKIAALTEQRREAQVALESRRHQSEDIKLRLSRLGEIFSELQTRAMGLDISYELFQESPTGSRKLVLLGNTGDGKSTLANRLVGDASKRGNCGPFKISGRAQSETSSVKSEIFEAFGNSFCLVDTPGMSDSSGPLADLSHANRLVWYLQGAEAIQAFLFVRNFRKSRLSKPDKDLLRELSDLLGKSFWENVVFVFTRVDDEDDEEELEECGAELVEQIRSEFELTSDTVMPIVGIGKSNFEARREEILTTVVNFEKEFSCEHLILPLDKLKDDMSKVQEEICKLEADLKENEIRIPLQEKFLDQIDHHLADLR